MLSRITLANVVAIACAAMGVSQAQAQTVIDWTGPGGVSNSGGSWNTATNWAGDNIPNNVGLDDLATTERANLIDVTSGNRIVTLDSALTTHSLYMTQTTADATNRLTLNANLTLNGGATTLQMTNGSILNLNGYRLSFSGESQRLGEANNPSATINFSNNSQAIIGSGNTARTFTLNGTVNVDAGLGGTATIGRDSGGSSGISFGLFGTTNVNSGTFVMRNSATNRRTSLTVEDGGVVNVAQNATLSVQTLTGTHESTGALRVINKTGGTINQAGNISTQGHTGADPLSPYAVNYINESGGTWYITSNSVSMTRINATNSGAIPNFANVGVLQSSPSGAESRLTYTDAILASNKMVMTNTGSINPGSNSTTGLEGIGALTLRNYAVVNDTGIMNLQIGGYATTEFDRFILDDGSLAVNGGTLNITFVDGFDPGSTEASWSLISGINSSTFSGTGFGTVTITGDNPLYVFDNDTASSTFGTLRVIPEPASLALLGLGGLAMLRRRSR